MDSLQSTKLGSFNKEQELSKPDLISSYLMSALSAQTVALGGNDKSHADINNKAYQNSVIIGYNAVATDTLKNSSVVAIGSSANANNWGTAVGVEAKANLGLAFGANAWAEGSANHMAIAIGRYAKATGQYAVQLGGDFGSGKYLAVNDENNTFKFYNGSKNVTIVKADGTISADNAYAATKLQTAKTIGGVSFDGTANIDLPGVNIAGNQNTSGKANTAGTADQAEKVKCNGALTDYVQLSVCTVAPTSTTAQANVLYLVVES